MDTDHFTTLHWVVAAAAAFLLYAPTLRHALRLRWLRMALAGEPRFLLDDVELRRGGTSYTVDTVRDVMARHPGAELSWLIGADHVPTLPKWREAPELARLVEFVVIPRPGSPPWEAPGPFRVRELRGWPLAVSSSLVRERIRAGLPVSHLVPPHVGEALRESRAYA